MQNHRYGVIFPRKSANSGDTILSFGMNRHRHTGGKGEEMNTKRPLGVTIFGIINIGLGIMPTIFLIMECIRISFFVTVIFLFTFFGWVTDREFKCFGDWFLLTIIERGSLIIFYLFSLLLVISGVTLIKRRLYSRKLTITSTLVIFLSWTINVVSSILHSYLYRGESFNLSPTNLIMPGIIFFILFIYFLVSIKYFTRFVIKEQFADTDIKLPFKKMAIVIFILIFGHLIIPGIGYIFSLLREFQGIPGT